MPALNRNPAIAGVVLAGGRSKRMGTSKALLAIEGIPLVERTRSILFELKPLVERVVISGSVPGFDSIADLLPRGPVGGIESVARILVHEGIQALLVVPVDLPRLDSDVLLPLLVRFVNAPSKALCYAKTWLPAIFQLDQEFVGQCSRHHSVHELLVSLSYESVPRPENDASLANANTPEEWAKLVDAPTQRSRP